MSNLINFVNNKNDPCQNNLPLKKKSSLTRINNQQPSIFKSFITIDDFVHDTNTSLLIKDNNIIEGSQFTFLTESPIINDLNSSVVIRPRSRNYTIMNEVRLNDSKNNNNSSMKLESRNFKSDDINIEKIISVMPSKVIWNQSRYRAESTKDKVMAELKQALSHVDEQQAQNMTGTTVKNMILAKKLKFYSLKLVSALLFILLTYLYHIIDA